MAKVKRCRGGRDGVNRKGAEETKMPFCIRQDLLILAWVALGCLDTHLVFSNLSPCYHDITATDTAWLSAADKQNKQGNRSSRF